jgi:poly [ADP-ribose] polymerase 2/3/4
LSKATLKAGFNILQEIDEVLRNKDTAMEKYGKHWSWVCDEISSKYYTTIPHITGRAKPESIDDLDKVSDEAAMLVCPPNATLLCTY